MSLCRHYVRELRRSVLVSTPDLEKGAGSKRSSQILDSYPFERDRSSSDQGPSGTYGNRVSSKEQERQDQDQRLSAFLRNGNGKNSPQQSSNSQQAPSEDITPGSEPPRPSFMTGNSASPSPLSHGNSNTSPNHTVASTLR